MHHRYFVVSFAPPTRLNQTNEFHGLIIRKDACLIFTGDANELIESLFPTASIYLGIWSAAADHSSWRCR